MEKKGFYMNGNIDKTYCADAQIDQHQELVE